MYRVFVFWVLLKIKACSFGKQAFIKNNNFLVVNKDKSEDIANFTPGNNLFL